MQQPNLAQSPLWCRVDIVLPLSLQQALWLVMTSAMLSCGHNFTPVPNVADLFARYLSRANETLTSLCCLFARGVSRKCLYFTFLIPRIQSSALSSANVKTLYCMCNINDDLLLLKTVKEWIMYYHLQLVTLSQRPFKNLLSL